MGSDSPSTPPFQYSSTPILFEKLRYALESRRLDLVTDRPLIFSLERNGRVDDRDGIAEPAAEALHLADNLDVLVPVHARGYGPHHFAFIEDIDVVIDDYGQFQIGHFDKRLHAGLV